MFCKIVYLELCTLSLADCDVFVVVISVFNCIPESWIHLALDNYCKPTLSWGVPACALFTHRPPGAGKHKITCIVMWHTQCN